jgi:hypothetical protein
MIAKQEITSAVDEGKAPRRYPVDSELQESIQGQRRGVRIGLAKTILWARPEKNFVPKCVFVLV